MMMGKIKNKSSWSPKLELVSWTLTTLYFAKKVKKVIVRTNYILDTLSTEYHQQSFTENISANVFYASEQPCMMMMRGSSNLKTKYTVKSLI